MLDGRLPKIHVSHCPPRRASRALHVAARSVSSPENDRSRRKDRGASAIEQQILRRGKVPELRHEHNAEHQPAEQRDKREGQGKGSGCEPNNNHAGTLGRACARRLVSLSRELRVAALSTRTAYGEPPHRELVVRTVAVSAMNGAAWMASRRQLWHCARRPVPGLRRGC